MSLISFEELLADDVRTLFFHITFILQVPRTDTRMVGGLQKYTGNDFFPLLC